MPVEHDDKMEHEHLWRYYDGALGYESYKCTLCNVDANDVRAKLTLEQLNQATLPVVDKVFVLENLIKLAQQHKKHCDGECGISLWSLRQVCRGLGITLTDEQKESFM